MVLLLLIMLALLLWLIQKELEQQGQEKEAVGTSCPACQAIVATDWLVCPHCRQRLKESCPVCHEKKLVKQKICPFCGASPRSATAELPPTQCEAPREQPLQNS